ncbi:MAG TPA: epoxide hydrolase N-terminal domain-containing protein, partial [Mucilaginibacter sp.]|nr:epoxide hydrolase N-terminal domain-containing protein [Mucilaginibacter sp.]
MKKNRNILTGIITAGIAGALTLFGGTVSAQSHAGKSKSSEAIRPFHVHVSQAALDDLHRRIQATRWPDKETVS